MRSQRSSGVKDDGKNVTQKKARETRATNTGSNVSNVVLFFGRATVEAQKNNNHSYYHL
ncbi:hypothetical protein [Pantoea sp. SOD02]|uniref:hypothetical protein n=1 Tax=Pantoea sp. SOD02 TaxID=2970818 RepID=UPI0012AD7284|nr:hypothetical protein [Pantoea sp. SOD02]UVC27638.1 hypothetical protein NR302_10130 [Pantoea sp. SOD02]